MIRIFSVALSAVFVTSVFAAVVVHVVLLQAMVSSLHGARQPAVTLAITQTR